ncbi:MAG: hypothetical protein QM724_11640 [Flavobacteriales bacterium]
MRRFVLPATGADRSSQLLIALFTSSRGVHIRFPLARRALPFFVGTNTKAMNALLRKYGSGSIPVLVYAAIICFAIACSCHLF